MKTTLILAALAQKPMTVSDMTRHIGWQRRPHMQNLRSARYVDRERCGTHHGHPVYRYHVTLLGMRILNQRMSAREVKP